MKAAARAVFLDRDGVLNRAIVRDLTEDPSGSQVRQLPAAGSKWTWCNAYACHAFVIEA